MTHKYAEWWLVYQHPWQSNNSHTYAFKWMKNAEVFMAWKEAETGGKWHMSRYVGTLHKSDEVMDYEEWEDEHGREAGLVGGRG